MMKSKRSISYNSRSKNKKSTNIGRYSPKFMKKSDISPRFQFTNFYESNFDKSPAPVAPLVFNNYENPYPVSSYSQSIEDQDERSNIKNDNTNDNTDDEYYENSDSYDSHDNSEREDATSMNSAFDTSYATSIRNKDMRIFKMKIILEEKKKQMFEKEREIRELHQNNSFLQNVINDYEKYNNAILEEKKKQKTAIKILSDHIRDISKEMNEDEYNLGRVKNDQYMLLEELKNIQNEMKQALLSNGRSNEYESSDEQISDHNSDYDLYTDE
jgi:hypothetical protein